MKKVSGFQKNMEIKSLICILSKQRKFKKHMDSFEHNKANWNELTTLYENK